LGGGDVAESTQNRVEAVGVGGHEGGVVVLRLYVRWRNVSGVGCTVEALCQQFAEVTVENVCTKFF